MMLRSDIDEYTLKFYIPEMALQQIVMDVLLADPTFHASNNLALVSKYFLRNTRIAQARLAIRVLLDEAPQFESKDHACTILNNAQLMDLLPQSQWAHNPRMIFCLARGIFNCLHYLDSLNGAFKFKIYHFTDGQLPDGNLVNQRDVVPYEDFRGRMDSVVNGDIIDPKHILSLMAELKDQLGRNNPPINRLLSIFSSDCATSSLFIKRAEAVISMLSLKLNVICIKDDEETQPGCIDCRFM